MTYSWPRSRRERGACYVWHNARSHGVVLTLAILTGCHAESIEPPPEGRGSDAAEDAPHDAAPDAKGCHGGFIGDPVKDPEIELVTRRADGTLPKAIEGSSVDLIFPPAGGFVLFAGARATNLDRCGVYLAGVLRDTASGQLVSDARHTNLEVAEDGRAETSGDLGSFANLAVCNNTWSGQNI